MWENDLVSFALVFILRTCGTDLASTGCMDLAQFPTMTGCQQFLQKMGGSHEINTWEHDRGRAVTRRCLAMERPS